MSFTAMAGLPSSIVSRTIVVNDLNIHILEASPSSSDPSVKAPLLIVLHGFPELAYSWRKVMAPLAAEDRKIVFDDDLAPFRMLNLATDIVALVYALGYTSVAAVIGHDFGSPVAAYCALIRPDIFNSVVLMSAPFTGPPDFSSAFEDLNAKSPAQQINEHLTMLDPPRKHYTIYFSTSAADGDMSHPPQGLHTFLRTYHHVKSADRKGNNAAGPLVPSASALSIMPHYYIMPLSQTMPECLASEAPSTEEMERNTWLPEDELALYVSQYQERGFQGGLNWYRCQTDGLQWVKDLRVFAGKQIDVPAMFIAGAQDWGVFQVPGAADTMRTKACRDMKDEDFVLLDGAGHWVQQEKPEAVLHHLLRFLRKSGLRGSH